MTKKELNDSEQEQADAAEALAILRAIRKSMRWTYGTNETEAEQANIAADDPGRAHHPIGHGGSRPAVQIAGPAGRGEGARSVSCHRLGRLWGS
ncbi:MAG: hypothetical protein NT011_08000 [Kiritimatiellaeota bacterium]|nr:hypothetical protein [Kiritimatiellota bacterium]